MPRISAAFYGIGIGRYPGLYPVAPYLILLGRTRPGNLSFGSHPINEDFLLRLMQAFNSETLAGIEGQTCQVSHRHGLITLVEALDGMPGIPFNVAQWRERIHQAPPDMHEVDMMMRDGDNWGYGTSGAMLGGTRDTPEEPDSKKAIRASARARPKPKPAKDFFDKIREDED